MVIMGNNEKSPSQLPCNVLSGLAVFISLKVWMSLQGEDLHFGTRCLFAFDK